MPRDLPVGNGSLLVNFDQNYQLRDIYWPYVGQENHTIGRPFRFGVWVDGQFSWTGGEGWQRELDYDHDTLVTHVRLAHSGLQLRLECEDAVDFHENLYLRQVTVHNDADHPREVRLFFAQDFSIGGTTVGDTAYYEPERRALFHYKGQRWFLINTAKIEPEEWTIGLDAWAVGVSGLPGREGTWRDAEDGELSGNAVVQGSVDSVGMLRLKVGAGGHEKGWYWIAAGRDFETVVRINRAVREKGPPTFLERTRHYWALWVAPEEFSLDDLSPAVQHLYRRSLLILRTQIDNHGAILAANDFDAVTFNRDTYSYMWARDGSMVAAALIACGYAQVSQRFFDFCHRVITPEGYLLHKYGPDGALASSWHGWYAGGVKVLPVQADETALVLWALWRHYQHFHEVEFIKPHYRGLVIRAANWLVTYRDAQIGLPQPSWDLWEERRGVSAWTVGATWGGLSAAADFAAAFGEDDLAALYRQTADEIRGAVERHLWQDDLGRFARMLHPQPDGGWKVDPVLDASLAGLWLFGMFAPDDPRIAATMKAIRAGLWNEAGIGGLARYQGDRYYQVDQDAGDVPGNPWFVCTLWLAQWHIAAARTLDDLQPARAILDWTAAHALPSGVLPEQAHPFSGAPVSVSPLTWSQAALVTTVRDYAARRTALLGSPPAPDSKQDG